MGKNGNLCCVVGCNNSTLNSPGVKFHSFSVKKHNSVQRELWIKAVRRMNPNGTPWQPTSSSRICSRHFIGGEKSAHPRSPSFAPTIFPANYFSKKQSERSAKNAVQRFERSVRRNKNSDPVNVEEPSISPTDKAQEDMDFETTEATSPEKNVRDQGTLVDLPYEHDMNIFICNHYENEKVSEAEVQACFSKAVIKKSAVTRAKNFLLSEPFD